MEPENKKLKIINTSMEVIQCKHFVIRKKRYCKMTVAKGKEFCGEHEIQMEESEQKLKKDSDRIVCPLDSKHTVYRKNLRKHLKICNARPKPTPEFIVSEINCGSDDEQKSSNLIDFKLSEVDKESIKKLITKIEETFSRYIKNSIEEIFASHKIMTSELAKKEYGKETLKHLIQTSSILGYLERFVMLEDDSTFIEFGAGKGQVSYWLGQLITNQNYKNSKVFLIDKASHRHKKDNKLENRDSVIRIRADISNLCMMKIPSLQDTKRIIGISKHLCGAATDLTLRCLMQDCSIPVKGFLIALCCHHRCEWKSFVGKEFLIKNNFNQKDFILITKMASWAICGTGYSRERRKEFEIENVKKDEENGMSKLGFTVDQRTEIGLKCKRLLDFARLTYVNNKNFNCSLKYYVKNDITLENVCLLAINKTLHI